jgi:hypothetical protein
MPPPPPPPPIISIIIMSVMVSLPLLFFCAARSLIEFPICVSIAVTSASPDFARVAPPETAASCSESMLTSSVDSDLEVDIGGSLV